MQGNTWKQCYFRQVRFCPASNMRDWNNYLKDKTNYGPLPFPCICSYMSEIVEREINFNNLKIEISFGWFIPKGIVHFWHYQKYSSFKNKREGTHF